MKMIPSTAEIQTSALISIPVVIAGAGIIRAIDGKAAGDGSAVDVVVF
jgi:hypothetical protein